MLLNDRFLPVLFLPDGDCGGAVFHDFHGLPDTEVGFVACLHQNRRLFLQQKKMLDTMLEHGVISVEKHDKSLHDLAENMGEPIN